MLISQMFLLRALSRMCHRVPQTKRKKKLISQSMSLFGRRIMFWK